MRSKTTIKRITAILILLIIVFGGINLFWYGFKYLPYKRMTGQMTLNNDPEKPRYESADNDYIYRVKLPGYLSFDSGFLYIGPNDEEAAAFVADEDGNLTEKNKPHVDMFIWPQMFSETRYGLTIYEETYSRQFLINGLGDFLTDESYSEEEKENAEELFEKHEDEIRDIMRAAKEMWGSQML